MLKRSALVIFLLLGAASTSVAQQLGNTLGNTYARPGRATMTIYVWGAVGSPGVWQVEREVGLIELLSVVRVPGVGVDQATVRRRFVLRIYRGENESRRQIYEERLERLIEEGDNHPDLQEGDILAVEAIERQRLSFRTVVQYVGSTASLVLLAIRLADTL